MKGDDMAGWLTVWADLQKAGRVARGILSVPADPRQAEATEILSVIAKIKKAGAEGRGVPVIYLAKLTHLREAANAKIIGPAMARGAVFNPRQRKGRVLPHTAAVDDALAALGPDAPTKVILQFLLESHHCTSDRENVRFRSGRGLTMHRFENLVSERRKLLRS